MVFGMFMAILDIQIVSASLAEIQAGLSASAGRNPLGADELPHRRSRHDPAVGLPLARVLDPLSVRDLGGRLHADEHPLRDRDQIDQMIVWRALQGFIGGGMIPTVFAAAFSIFPSTSMPIVSPIIGLVATLAPTIGPTVGGYLTDLYSWHWLFLINVAAGHRGRRSLPGS